MTKAEFCKIFRNKSINNPLSYFNLNLICLLQFGLVVRFLRFTFGPASFTMVQFIFGNCYLLFLLLIIAPL